MKKDGARLRSLLIGGIAFTGLASLAAVSAWAHPASQHGKDEVFKIGFVGPITGPNAAIGIGIRNSLELRINQANERGELPFKLEFVPETDDSKPAVGVAAVQKLCSDDKIIAASSHWNSPVAIATNPYYKDCGLLNLIPGTGSNKITEMGFTAIGRTATAYKFVLPYLGDKAANVLGLKSMALIHSRDDYGTDQTDEFQANYEASGGKVVAREGYNVGDRDFTAILTKIRASKPEGIFHGGLFTEGALIAKQMRQLGMKQLYVGQPGMQSETYIKTAGEEGEGTILVQMIPFPEEIPGGKQYMADYVKANFKDPPDTFGPPAYVAGEVLIELIKRHGPHRQAIMGGLRKITPETPFETIYGKIWFDPAGELRPKPVGLIELKGGEWTPYKPKK